jgi:hypothetical protein
MLLLEFQNNNDINDINNSSNNNKNNNIGRIHTDRDKGKKTVIVIICTL